MCSPAVCNRCGKITWTGCGRHVDQALSRRPAREPMHLLLRPASPIRSRAPGDGGAALMHASQISPAAVLWRRLQLQGGCEHLRWLRSSQEEAAFTAQSAGSGG